MTPGARVQAAIEILDAILGGAPAEKALTGWARKSRFAGSKDRAAVRDHVYDALRKRRSAAACGGALTGRALMLGLMRLDGGDPATRFDGAGHAPEPLTPGEGGIAPSDLSPGELADLPDWVQDRFHTDLGPEATAVMLTLRDRAPVFLRVNLLRGDRDAAIAALADDGIGAEAHPHVATALRVTDGARRLRASHAFETGLVELQDASSQAAVAALPSVDGARVLDFCAGGGGKALALAAAGAAEVVAHDIEARRMSDLPNRAARAGAQIEVRTGISPETDGTFDLVLIDAPCSGSGTWRRDPEGKWRLTPAALDDLVALQSRILRDAADFVAPGGTLAYATCSIFEAENRSVIEACVAERRELDLVSLRRWLPDEWGDGFHLGIMRRAL
ncbi:RsmB/NOP family class I SAM-dependent RNA methyltransferase [Ponticoccus sp. SC2-23]|uniref:RsmB/NOP family class I SAM-dependent RNA methyltransferase n=1 Tax=Alexandriicola marinus TaxID=2081710 RepID=UPI000FDBAED5|nr:RsmB/NOP family class I SAM-dependent RNA methyltransferase [Alexandriicola marinus]MBM1222272.1 RsmB/NOP family class I SAM-dependent RNA methyltransferase [Ponticoccus sp. SC6-9]MBM1224385.1 RsmB/NOP family class I SAM-dependent RNA methyltransferase [Ponticoccus sp. SC6-15]MBM1229835.1 RsmB/NOP family class I SAM-dependent RNA methyltransferase [Ponticoccus sp. SC6-38]MBM1233351.1 RsmB/NOP family class I SAM-dependent RNA methyltransferase [Ponticoccus sp. SC6-45]MBM1236699.1 RsmB/NOP fa